MKFMEFVGLLFILYLATQIFLPTLLPKIFETNWFFKDLFHKKKLPISDKVEQLSNQKGRLQNKINETVTEVENEAERTRRAQEELEKLK